VGDFFPVVVLDFIVDLVNKSQILVWKRSRRGRRRTTKNQVNSAREENENDSEGQE